MGDTKAAFSELLGSARVGVSDARDILAKRWQLYVAIVVVSAVADLLIARFTSPPAAPYATGLAGIVTSFYLWYDTLRLALPTFRYTPQYILRFVGTSIAMLLMVLAIALVLGVIASFVVPASMQKQIFIIEVWVAALLALNRFIFVWYILAEDRPNTNSFGVSWSLTGGSMLLPNFALNLISVAISIVLEALDTIYPAWLRPFATLSAGIVDSAIVFPVCLRWMQACAKEREAR